MTNDSSVRSLTCDVCRQREAKGVASSALGPVSWAYCVDCLAANAEPSVMFDATLDGCGGIEAIADWARRMNTYVDGKYISLDEYASLHKGNTNVQG